MKRLTDMYMSFRGIRNDSVGAQLVSMPTRQATALRGEKEVLPGRDGFLLIPTGYQEITIKVTLVVPDNADLAAVKSWLSGTGELIFGDFPEYAYEATVMTPTALSSATKRLAGQKFTVTFTCQPFMHLVSESQIILTSGSVFRGQGDVNSMPLVKVEGSGTHTLTINGRGIDVTLTSGTALYLDCDAGLSYTLSGSSMVFAGQNVTVRDDWFELYPASSSSSNIVSFPSGITRVTLTPRWRFF